MNSKATGEEFYVDIDMAINQFSNMSKCLDKKWNMHCEEKCDNKCDECDYMYGFGNCGQIENLFENVQEWLEDYKKIKEQIAFISSKPIEELCAEYYNKALADFVSIVEQHEFKYGNRDITKTFIDMTKFLVEQLKGEIEWQ